MQVSRKKKFLPRIGSSLLYFMWSNSFFFTYLSPPPNLLVIWMDAGVSAIVFHPTRSMAVSTSFGGDFKVVPKNWFLFCIIPFSASFKKLLSERARRLRIMHLALTRRINVTAAAFSGDGTILAVAAENSVTKLCFAGKPRVVVTAVALSLDGSVMRTTEVKLPEDGIGGLVSLNFWVNQTTKLSPYPQSFMNLARMLVSRPLPSTLPVPWQLVHPLVGTSRFGFATATRARTAADSSWIYVCPEIVADVVAEADVVVSGEDHVESRDRDTGADLIEREREALGSVLGRAEAGAEVLDGRET
ncbi:hypothetical protein DY000_02020422 [Brassica cretica]|uniref:Anaphase-promoting complex subunit 4 WD40 domain-containing protein n=1 Tax=Brassica cretica TaxID=69181 RepID=A0ABQ7E6P3_BRACR|nr:hypothetical protein DY000_02020422 [Brassica cretica]